MNALLLKTVLKPAGALTAGILCLAAFGIQQVFAADIAHVAENAHLGDGSGHEAAAGHAADAAAHGSGGLPQFDPTSFSSQVFWLAIAFALMYMIFSRKTLPAISSVLENRREQVKGDHDTAERLTNEAEAVLDSYEKGLDKARLESAQLSAGAVEDGKKQVEAALQSFQQRAEDQIAALEGRLTDGKNQAMDEMNTIAAEIASAAAEKIVGISTDIGQVKSVVQSLSKEAA